MTQPSRRIDPEMEAQLGLDESSGARSRRTWLRRGVWVLVALALLAGLVWWRARGRAERAPRYVTTPVERGDLAVTVTATGTLSALDTVEVSSEVSGRVADVLVDYNSRVKKGQVLAILNPDQAQARAQESAAQVEAANAALRKARASAEESNVKLNRAKELSSAGLLSKDDLDSADATARRAQADVGSAAAQVTVARASLDDARSALRKTSVVSPIDGIVLSRSVEPGQTVAASLQAPVLFTLARDLTKMKLVVSIDEADVGKVHEGDPARFTVDAFPGRAFHSRVEQLRNIAKTDQNVVTYEAVLSVANDDLSLRPGMTATANVIAEEKRAVLLVPNAALRFTPPDVLAQENGARGGLFIPGVTRGNPFGRRGQGQGQGQGQRGGPGGGGASSGAQGAGGAAAGARPAGSQGGGPGGAQGGIGGRGAPAGAAAPGGRRGGFAGPGGGSGAGGFGGGAGEGAATRVWVLRGTKPDAKPEPVWVRTGDTDGRMTELVGGQLEEGDAVIVDLATTGAKG